MPTEVHDNPAQSLYPKITVLVHGLAHWTEVEAFAVRFHRYPGIWEGVIEPRHHPALMSEFVLRNESGKVRMVNDAAHDFLKP